MSFTNSGYTSRVYAPGWFLAAEQCVRKTRQADSTDQRVITVDGGGKFLPMGTIYPTNDSNAEGIVYEDVDVTTGDMPCSVVLSGVVYENRLAPTNVAYNSVTIGDYVSPVANGWYESSEDTYALSTDTTADDSKTYYRLVGGEYSEVVVGDYVNPKKQGWFELEGTEYTETSDTKADESKTYYSRTVTTISSAAKTALQAKGFVFVTETTVERG